MADVPSRRAPLRWRRDSSLITSIAVRQRKLAKNTYGADEPVHSFSIGIKGAPDLVAARKVAEQLEAIHHEVHFTPEEALDALPDVIWHLETFEQVRASVPMYLLSRHIKSLGFKMVLSGEGAGELFGGYLYFHKAPNPAEFHAECRRKTMRLHQWDVLRANKSTMSWGIEVRTPLLSQQVIDVAMNMRPEDKMIDINKKDADGRPYLKSTSFERRLTRPRIHTFRKRSSGAKKSNSATVLATTGSCGLAAHAELEVSDEEFARRAERFALHRRRRRSTTSFVPSSKSISSPVLRTVTARTRRVRSASPSRARLRRRFRGIRSGRRASATFLVER